MQIVSIGDNVHDMSNLSGENKKNSIKMLVAGLAKRVV